MRVVRVLIVTGTVLAGAVGALAQSQKKFDFAVIGDAPYGPATGTGTARVQVYPAPAYERLIADINSTLKDNKSFLIHVGDIKEGNSRCDDNVYTTNRDYFNTFDMAAIFIPWRQRVDRLPSHYERELQPARKACVPEANNVSDQREPRAEEADLDAAVRISRKYALAVWSGHLCDTQHAGSNNGFQNAVPADR